MALFVRHTEDKTSAHLVPAYDIGQQKTLVIVGLGNPGKDYDGTRHNIGFASVDRFAADNGFPAWIAKKDFKCHISQHALGDSRVILVKPTTYMNSSGEAVQAILHFYKLPVESLVVVHDELDIGFGVIRTQKGGGTAGHNGLKSLVAHCTDAFGRIRIGIKNPLRDKMDGADFVLAKFNKEEQTHLKTLTQEVSAILTETIYGDGLVPETRQFIIET